MKIGIDASRAYFSQRTGIEEYSYQVIKHLADKLKGHEVVLYVRKEQFCSGPTTASVVNSTDVVVGPLDMPQNWKIKVIKFPYLWTQLGLSLEMFLHPVDVLFVPAHVVPIIHPENTVVTVHGLEYEFCPEAYSVWERIYMRWSIKMSCRWAKKIISVSENTKKDLVKLYHVPESKISVVYEGYENCHSERSPEPDGEGRSEESRSNTDMHNITGSFANAQDDNKKYLLFIGRLESRKNINGIIDAYKILKERYKILHSLVLAGKLGHGYKKINYKLQTTNYKHEIILPGFVNDEKKQQLLANADVFLFPSFYEGFGLPILEAQAAGVPVVASNNSSIPEIVGARRDEAVPRLYESAILVDPQNPSEIAEATYKLISDKALRDDIIQKGHENVKRFSWDRCAEEIAKIICHSERM